MDKVGLLNCLGSLRIKGTVANGRFGVTEEVLKKDDTKLYLSADWNDPVDQRKVGDREKDHSRNKILEEVGAGRI